jgi:hypothetical protein
MCKHVSILALLAVASLGCGDAGEHERLVGEKQAVSTERRANDPEAVQMDVRRLEVALYGGDPTTVLELTHPKVVAEWGEPAEARHAVETQMAMKRSFRMNLESLTFPEPPQFFSSETQDFVIVPYVRVATLKGRRSECHDFQLGAKPHRASKWTFIAGSRAGRDDFARSCFRDFPPKQTLPKRTFNKL